MRPPYVPLVYAAGWVGSYIGLRVSAGHSQEACLVFAGHAGANLPERPLDQPTEQTRTPFHTTNCSALGASWAKRSSAKGERSMLGVLPTTSSARCSPTTGLCWKPCPEKPVA